MKALTITCFLVLVYSALLFSQTNEPDIAWIAKYGSGLSPTSSGTVNAFVVDKEGNIYVTCMKDSNFVTIKYNTLGSKQWESSYNGTGNSIDYPTAINIDGLGNVFIAGKSYGGSATDYDFATVKYNSSGVQQWVTKYNGTKDSIDTPGSIIIDVTGNSYVTGTSFDIGSDSNFTAIKYNSSGVQQWILHQKMNLKAFSIDTFGNIYTITDTTMIKKNSSGNQLWKTTYSDGNPRYIAIDKSGNVYVIASGYIGFSFDTDYELVKYNSSGVKQWMKSCDGRGGDDTPVSIAIDTAGYIYFTGASNTDIWTGDYNYVTAKYDPLGAQQWLKTFGGTSIASPSNMVVDISGNAYVTGNVGTVKYNETGVQQWVISAHGLIAADGSNNFYTSGPTTVKYNSSGTVQWTIQNEILQGGEKYYARNMVIDNSGNTYVIGNGISSVTTFSTIKYNSAGVTVWVRNHVSSGFPSAIEVDNAGNVYVTGFDMTGTDMTSGVYVTLKYNNVGDSIWCRTYNGPGNGFDKATDIAIDGTGHIYITGISKGLNSYDYATIKYNSVGDTLWVRRYNGVDMGINSDLFPSIVVDKAENVYVTGCGSGSPPNYKHYYATIKYNSSGDTVWVRKYYGSGNGQQAAKAIAVDGSGNVYVTGTSFGSYGVGGSTTRFDYATIKYNSEGDTVWVRRYNGPGNYDDGASSIAVDIVGNVYVTGSSRGLHTSDDYATIKYNSVGDTLWVRRYNGPDSGGDYVSALSIDSAGNVYVTGKSLGANTGMDYATVKYNSNGVEQWVIRYSSTGNYNDTPVALALDGSGNIFVFGTSNETFCTIKYTPKSSSVQKFDPSEFSVICSPNPAIDEINLIIEAKEPEIVVSIVSLEGKSIYSKTYQNDSNKFFAKINLSNQSSGMYFITINDGRRILTKKIILK